MALERLELELYLLMQQVVPQGELRPGVNYWTFGAHEQPAAQGHNLEFTIGRIRFKFVSLGGRKYIRMVVFLDDECVALWHQSSQRLSWHQRYDKFPETDGIDPKRDQHLKTIRRSADLLYTHICDGMEKLDNA